MFIYVAGPYSPQGLDPQSQEGQELIRKSVEEANEIALAITKKGHTPFVPHTMMVGWEDSGRITRKEMMHICHEWLKKCDAIFFIASSPGADSELKLAKSIGLKVFQKLEEIPEAMSSFSLSNPDANIIHAYLTEYKECIESYRHTYATIWQAGGMFSAIAAAVIAFWGSKEGPIPIWVLALAPVPILFWYQGIFRPMNRYGEIRRNRVEEIENTLEQLVPGLAMSHFVKFNQSSYRPEKPRIRKVISKFFVEPRVNYSVHLLGIGSLIFEAYLFIRYLLVPLGSQIMK